MSEEWTADQCAKAWGVRSRTWHGYVARDQAPKPARHVGRTPVWDPDAVRTYPRPGRGTRTDLKETTVTTETDPISDRIQAYVTSAALNLSDHAWARAAWGTRGPQGPAELRDINERLYGDVDTRAILIAENTGRDNHDPAVLAEIDMDSVWTAACASHLTDWADTQIVALREEEAATAAAYEARDTEWSGQDHSERIAQLTEMRNGAAKTAAGIEASVRRAYDGH